MDEDRTGTISLQLFNNESDVIPITVTSNEDLADDLVGGKLTAFFFVATKVIPTLNLDTTNAAAAATRTSGLTFSAAINTATRLLIVF